MTTSPSTGFRPHKSSRRSAAALAALTLTATATGTALGAGQAAAAAASAVSCNAASLVSAMASVANTGGTLSLAGGCRYTLTAPDNQADGATGLPAVNAAVTITGNGATITRSATSGTPNFRILDVGNAGALTIKNVTLSNGLAPLAPTPEVGWGGGAINSHGTLHVTKVTFAGNAAPSHTGTSGGAIDSAGPLTVTRSRFRSNQAQEGGAIFAQDTTSIVQSTFAGNTATDYGGGAIVSAAGTTTISASTFANNVAVDTGTPPTGYTLGGGAIDNDAYLDIRNSTFFHNAGGSNGGGAIQNFGTAGIRASTFAGNTSAVTGSDIHTYADPSAPVPVVTTVTGSILASGGTNCGGNVATTDGGYNIDAGSSCGFAAANHSATNTDAQLGPLANNGGPTQTMAPQAGSAALDAIPASDPACGTTDQRGIARPQGAGCDIGAVELVVAQPATHTTGQLSVSGGQVSLAGTVTDGAGQPQPGVQVVVQKRTNRTAPWSAATTVTTGADGSYSYTEAAPTALTYYRAWTPADATHTGSVSPVRTQKAPTALTLVVQQGTPDQFTATLVYTGTGGAVAQRRVVAYYHYAPSKHWLALTTLRTDANGQVTFSMQPGRRCGFIVRFAGNQSELASSSRPVSVPR